MWLIFLSFEMERIRSQYFATLAMTISGEQAQHSRLKCA